MMTNAQAALIAASQTIAASAPYSGQDFVYTANRRTKVAAEYKKWLDVQDGRVDDDAKAD